MQDESALDFQSDDLPDLDSILRQPDNAPSFGIQTAAKDEIEKADAILKGAPSNRTPLEVMRYFEALQDKNKDGELYNAGWKVRWNPVIVRFFSATNFGRPAGDTTSWCAASLNWCLKQSGFQNGTHSAASASFRNAPGRIDNARPGDIVVFVENADHDHGHVTLYISGDAERVRCLGGNQADQVGHHAICTKWIPKHGSFLTFHSYHSADAFR